MPLSAAKALASNVGRSLAVIPLLWPTSSLANRPTHQFENFFPAWEPFIRQFLAGNCSDEYATYLDTTIQETRVSYDLIGCLLQNLPEYRKAEMATSALVLGLTPFIIQQMGPRLADVSTLALRRPILALLIAASCPIVSADMAGTWSNPIAHLARPAEKTMRPGLENWMKPRRRTILSVAAVEYLLAATAFVNIQVLMWQLSTWAVLSYSPATDFQVWLWSNLVLLIHVGHIWSVRLRVQVVRGEQLRPERGGFGDDGSIGLAQSSIALDEVVSNRNALGDSATTSVGSSTEGGNANTSNNVAHTSNTRSPWHGRETRRDREWCHNVVGSSLGTSSILSCFPARFDPQKLRQLFKHEFTPLAYAKPIILEPRPHGYFYFVLGYLVSAAAAAHVLFGTLVLSSLIFISLRDSVGIVWRFGASTIVCRMILGYEITAARERVSGVADDKDR